MKKINVTVEGKTPLICNRFTEQAQMDATEGTSSSIKGDRGTPREQAEPKRYVGKDGKTEIIPSPNLFSCIIEAGKFFKNGKSKITTQKTSLIPACVEIDALEIELEHEEPWEVDTRPVRIPSTGGRILCHRPLYNDWKLSFVVNLDHKMMSPKMFREIVDAAGSRVGLGDFRPACKGPYGKFNVVEWKEE
jgi:hypothetical protein